ncbi:MAG: hypothetical protein WC428_07330 [Candidatus Paceibacterota bacterium]|jgi:hypothetical protein
MPLPKHDRNNDGSFRRERNDSLAGNLRKDYTEFNEFRSDAKLGTIKEKLGLPEDASINEVRKAIREEK